MMIVTELGWWKGDGKRRGQTQLMIWMPWVKEKEDSVMTSRFGAGAIEKKDVLQMTSCWVGMEEQRGGRPDTFYQLEYSLVSVALTSLVGEDMSGMCLRGGSEEEMA